MIMPSAWPRSRPSTAENASASAGANWKPALLRCCRERSSKKCPRAKISRIRAECVGVAPPVVLHLAQAFAADDAGAEIRARQFVRLRLGALDQLVDRDVDRALIDRHWRG